MRKIGMTIMAGLLFTVGTLSANTLADEQPKNGISAQIHQLLKSNSFDVPTDIQANVRFTFNKEGELVVLSVDTEHQNLEAFVKSRLNYQKLENLAVTEGKIYTVKVTIEA